MWKFLLTLTPLIVCGDKSGILVDRILNKNDTYLLELVNCLMDITPICLPEYDLLRDSFVKELETDCKNCRLNTHEHLQKIIVFLKKNQPEMFKQLMNKFDPSGKYAAKYKTN